MRTLLLHEDSVLWKNQNLTPETSIALQRICRSLVNGTLEGKLHFTTWIWLTDKSTPMRLPALILPTLRIMRRLRELGVVGIQYHVYQATDFIIRETMLDEEKARKNAVIMERYLRHFIQKCYPDLEDDTSLEFWFEIDTETVRQVSDELRKFHDESSFSPALNKLIDYATSKWMGRDSALRYSAANLIWNGHIQWRGPFCLWENDVIIPIWWLKERPFFELGKSYEARKQNEWKVREIIPLIQHTGSIPTYYPQKWEDTIDQNGKYIWVDSSQSLHSSVCFDRDIVLHELWTDDITSLTF